MWYINIDIFKKNYYFYKCGKNIGKGSKMLRRILAIAMLSCIVLFGAACDKAKHEAETKSKLDPQNPITITLWHYYFDEKEQVFNDFVDEFNSTVGAEKGIIVEPINKGRIIDLEKDLTDSAHGVINSDKMPNIFSSYIDKAVELSNLNKIVDLNDYYTEDEKQTFIESFIEAGTYNKKFMVLPIVKSTEVLYVNKTKWDEVKRLKNFTDDDLSTWEGISKVAGSYASLSKNKEEQGFFGYESIENFIIIAMKEQGVEVIDGENKSANPDKAALKRFFDIYFPNMIEGKFYIGGKFRTDNVKTGELVAYTGSIAGARYFPLTAFDNDVEKPIEMLALVYPTFEGCSSSAMLQGAGMCVAKASDAEIEASVEFLKWFTKDVNNLEFAIRTAYLPVRKGLYEGAAFENTVTKLKKEGDQCENLAAIYELIRDRVIGNKLYYVKPFEKSYKVREILGQTLQERVDAVKPNVVKPGNIDIEAEFDVWFKRIKEELNKNEIKYE